jgi:hypothetical protein
MKFKAEFFFLNLLNFIILFIVRQKISLFHRKIINQKSIQNIKIYKKKFKI